MGQFAQKITNPVLDKHAHGSSACSGVLRSLHRHNKSDPQIGWRQNMGHWQDKGVLCSQVDPISTHPNSCQVLTASNWSCITSQHSENPEAHTSGAHLFLACMCTTEVTWVDRRKSKHGFAVMNTLNITFAQLWINKRCLCHYFLRQQPRSDVAGEKFLAELCCIARAFRMTRTLDCASVQTLEAEWNSRFSYVEPVLHLENQWGFGSICSKSPLW